MKGLSTILRTVGVSVVLLGTFSLSGCFAFPMDPGPLGTAAIQRDGEGIRIAVCEPIALTKVVLEQRNRATKQDWVRIWESVGRIDLGVEDTFTTSVSAGGLQIPETQPTIATDEEFSMLITGPDGDTLAAGFGPLSSGDLDSTRWLQSNGKITDAPCPPIEDLRS